MAARYGLPGRAALGEIGGNTFARAVSRHLCAVDDDLFLSFCPPPGGHMDGSGSSWDSSRDSSRGAVGDGQKIQPLRRRLRQQKLRGRGETG